MTIDTASGTERTRVPALEGWFTLDEVSPALLGSKCTTCGNYTFPGETQFCRNPACMGTEFDTVELSRQGRIWSYTDACYQPPPPFVPTDPHVPFCIAAVELEAEKIVVMGQIVGGVSVNDLSVGDPVELVLDTLYTDDEHEYLVWKWRPLGATATTSKVSEG
jgi:uncharacterized protein